MDESRRLEDEAVMEIFAQFNFSFIVDMELWEIFA